MDQYAVLGRKRNKEIKQNNKTTKTNKNKNKKQKQKTKTKTKNSPFDWIEIVDCIGADSCFCKQFPHTGLSSLITNPPDKSPRQELQVKHSLWY